MNLYALLAQAARRFPDAGAVYRGTEPVHDYATLDLRARRLAASLLGLGGPGERIAIASENRVEYLELLFGTWAAGMVVVPINAKLHPLETRQIVADAGARAVFASPKLARELAAVLAADAGTAAVRTVAIGSAGYEALFDTPPADAPAVTEPGQLAWLFYTSGTTGRSKGAMLSHRNLMAMTVAHLADMERIDEGASQIHAAPMSHGSGLYIPAYVSRGARQVVPASGAFDPAEFVELCRHHPSCGAFLAPTMVQRLRQHVEQGGPRPTGLRCVVYGGGPMYVEELKKSMRTLGPVFAQIYGQGESPMTITGLRREDHLGAGDAVLGSVGFARTGVEVRVVDGQGRALPPGEIGEIVCRGDVVMSGYWNNPQGTAEALRGGWLHTGDMGAMDARGCLSLRDRSKDVVISGGSNIYPREVEEALLSHPGVAEACVVGQPDAEWGEVVVAFVVPGPGGATAQALDGHCLERIARFKRPKRYLFVDALPKNPYGKVLKRELRQRLAPAGTGEDAGEH